MALAAVWVAGLGLAWAQPMPATAESTSAVPTLAQPADPQAVRSLAETLRANREALAQWRWKSRVEIRIDGELRDVQYFQVRSDAEGRRRGKLIGGEAVVVEDGGALAHAMATTPERGAGEQGTPLRALADSYCGADLSAGALPIGAVRVEPLPGEPEPTPATPPAARRLVLHDVVRQGDTLEVTMSEDAGRPLRFDVTTSWQGAPTEIAIEFSQLPGGPFHDARTSIRATIEGRAVAITVESFDFNR